MSRARHRVVWTEVALGDVERLAAYLVDEAPGRAVDILDRLLARADSLAIAPRRGRTPPELRAIPDRAWREIQESPWRILYRVVGTTVEIHGVLDGRRSLEDILVERLLRS